MPKYSVLLRETLAHTIVVEANNQDEAMTTAYQLIATADPDTYSTLSEGVYETELIGEVNA